MPTPAMLLLASAVDCVEAGQLCSSARVVPDSAVAVSCIALANLCDTRVACVLLHWLYMSATRGEALVCSFGDALGDTYGTGVCFC